MLRSIEIEKRVYDVQCGRISPYMLFPHVVKSTHFQPGFSVNVWVSVVNGMFTGHYLSPPCRTGLIYLDFLWHILPHLLKDFPLNVR